MRLEVGDHRVQVRCLDTQTEVIDVSPAIDARLRRRDKIDDAGAGTQLDKSDMLDAALLMQTDNPGVEVKRTSLITASQDDVVEFRDFERLVHCQFNSLQPNLVKGK